jgi:hypothetical protein
MPLVALLNVMVSEYTPAGKLLAVELIVIATKLDAPGVKLPLELEISSQVAVLPAVQFSALVPVLLIQ